MLCLLAQKSPPQQIPCHARLVRSPAYRPNQNVAQCPAIICPRNVPGSTISLQKCPGNSSRSISSLAQVRVSGLTSCVVVAFVNSHTALPGKPVVKQIGNSDQFSRRPQQRRRFSNCGKQLVQRVDGHELNPGSPVNLFLRDFSEHFLHHTDGSRVSVMIRILQQLSFLAKQRVIHSPSVHTNPCQPCFLQARQSLANLPPQARYIPVQASAIFDGLIFESTDFLRCQNAATQVRARIALPLSAPKSNAR